MSKLKFQYSRATIACCVNCVNEETQKHQKTTFLSDGTTQDTACPEIKEDYLLSLLLSSPSTFVEFWTYLTQVPVQGDLPFMEKPLHLPHACNMLNTGLHQYPHSHSGDLASRSPVRTEKWPSVLSWQKYSRIQNSLHNLFTENLLTILYLHPNSG